MLEGRMKEKFYLGSVAGITAFIAGVPHNIRNYLALIFILVTVDTITGVLGAIACRELRSSHMRQKLSAKTLQYAMFSAMGFAATILSESWIFMAVVCGGIMAAEVSSMIENLAKMQSAGVSLGPFNHAIAMLSGFFTSSHTDKGITAVETTTATVFPPRASEEPVISTTTTKVSSVGKPDRAEHD